MTGLNFSIDETLARISRSRILILGDVMLDRYIWGSVTRISPEAPVPVVAVKKETNAPGGAGNVATNLSAMGCSVTIAGMGGQDAWCDTLNTIFKSQGIDACIIEDKDRKTITKTRIIAQKQQLLRMDEEMIHPLSDHNVNTILDFFKGAVQAVDAVILSDYNKGFFQTPGLCRKLIDLTNQAQKPVFIDPKGVDWERYQYATCVTPNTSEFESIQLTKDSKKDLLSEDQLIDACRFVKQQYRLSNLLVTRGAEGMCLIDSDDKPFIIPTQAKEVFDVSGAGDTVIAALAAGITAGLSFVDAARLANIAAGVVVGKIGTQPVTIEELKTACKEDPMLL